MPRTARASVGGVCYHVLNRGNGRMRVFHDAGDYEAFVHVVGCEQGQLAAQEFRGRDTYLNARW